LNGLRERRAPAAASRFHRGGWSVKETDCVRKIIEDAAAKIAGEDERG